MASRGVSVLKFVGTVSLGLLTVSLTFFSLISDHELSLSCPPLHTHTHHPAVGCGIM